MIEYVSRSHNQAYLRRQSKRAIERRERIVGSVEGVELSDYMNSPKGYAKGGPDRNKVHCSCKTDGFKEYLEIEKGKMKSEQDGLNKGIRKYI